MIREASARANNQDALVWALYVLGGADRNVDVEEIYLKAFEIAPARLGWRTHPEIPDYKKTAKALQSVEAKELPGLLAKPHALSRRFTPEGIAWVERNRARLQGLYGGDQPVQGAPTAVYETLRRELQASFAFSESSQGRQPSRVDIADALQCSPGSPDETWRTRLAEVRRASQVLQDESLAVFAEEAELVVFEEERSS